MASVNRIGAFTERNPTVFQQGLYDESSTQIHRLGTVRMLSDGRCFVYSQAGATALVAGKLGQSSIPIANHDELTTTAAAAEAKTVTVTLGATAATANQYAEGFLMVNKGTSIGHMYKIRSHPAADASATLALTLYEELRVAITDEECSLSAHPAKGILVCPVTLTGAVSGVTPIAVTALYYFWNQVKGMCAVLTDGTVVIGNQVRASEDDVGAVAALDYDEASADQPIVGQVVEVGADTEISFILLDIPGY